MSYQSATLYYFSGTGNARNAAAWIADELRKAGIPSEVTAMEKVTGQKLIPPAENTLTGFCGPTHGFHFPGIVRRFMKGFPEVRNASAFVLNTRAGLRIGKLFLPGLSGVVHYWSCFVLRRKGFRIAGLKAADLPSNWLLLHPAVRQKGVEAMYKRVEPRVRRFGRTMAEGKTDYSALRDMVQDILISPVSLGYDLAGKYFFSKSLVATSDCTHCGICAKLCPVDAIREVKGRMYWTSACEGCMRCVNACPEQAIETAHGFIVLVVLVSMLIFGGISTLLLQLGVEAHIKWLENGWVWFGIFSILMFPLLFLIYRIVHLAMRYTLVARLVTWTSLSKYPFWGRYRPPVTPIKSGPEKAPGIREENISGVRIFRKSKMNDMSENEELVRIYTGTEIKVRLLKDILEESGIPGVIRNNFQSGLAAGFGGGLPSEVDLYIRESLIDKANPIVKDFREQNRD